MCLHDMSVYYAILNCSVICIHQTSSLTCVKSGVHEILLLYMLAV